MEFETQLRDKEKEKELLEEKISKQDLDVSSYLQLIEVKDQSIVKLSNQLDELELAVKIDKASTPPIVGKNTRILLQKYTYLFFIVHMSTIHITSNFF